MYQQFNENAYLDKVINMVDKVREELVAMKKEATATNVEEIIEHEGLKLRKVNREAQEGDYIRPTADSDSSCIVTGKIYGPMKENKRVVGEDNYTWLVYRDEFNRTTSTVEVFEVVKEITPEDLPFPEVELSANQRRAAVIQEAKRYIASKVKNGLVQIGEKTYKAHFHRKGKMVSCVLNDLETGYTHYVDKAKCGPTEVFNEHIGQAIALGRIIGIPRKMFLKATQPNEFVVGQVTAISDAKSSFYRPMETIRIEDGKAYDQNEQFWTIEALRDGECLITDDTNAKY
ncbi:hypothetical protein [Rummeliibacillus stabekisii]|uniref:hypothetical protein n=1 Tax=Rummeliibacillus stabekisii TaxID=241244 RepID=UPI00371F4EF6